MERGWLDSEMFADAAYDERSAWAWMIGEARFSDGLTCIKGTPQATKRGQFYSSIRFMADKFGWSKDRVSRYLERLKKWGAICVETATGENLITVCNYEDYQGPKDAPKDAPKDGVGDAPKDAPKDKLEEIQINSKNVLEGVLDAPPQIEIPEKSEKKKGTRLPDDWTLPDAWGDWAMTYCVSKGLFDGKPFVIEQGVVFKNYWTAKTSQATKRDWQGTWENWIRRGLPDYQLKQKRLEREKSYEQVRRGR